jgi:hypothetical protein
MVMPKLYDYTLTLSAFQKCANMMRNIMKEAIEMVSAHNRAARALLQKSLENIVDEFVGTAFGAAERLLFYLTEIKSKFWIPML